MIESIRQTGLAKRNTRSFNDAIHVEKAKRVDENIKQLTNDIQQIKNENKTLKQQIKSKMPKS